MIILPIAAATTERMNRVRLAKVRRFLTVAPAAILVTPIVTGLVRLELVAGLVAVRRHGGR